MSEPGGFLKHYDSCLNKTHVNVRVNVHVLVLVNERNIYPLNIAEDSGKSSKIDK